MIKRTEVFTDTRQKLKLRVKIKTLNEDTEYIKTKEKAVVVRILQYRGGEMTFATYKGYPQQSLHVVKWWRDLINRSYLVPHMTPYFREYLLHFLSLSTLTSTLPVPSPLDRA